MNFGLSHYDSGPSSILNSVLCFTFLSANTADAPFLVITLQSFDVLDLKSLHIQIVKSEDGHRVLNLKSQHKGFQEISSFLDSADVFSQFGRPELNSSPFSVHSHLNFHMLDQSLEDGIPMLLQWGEPMPRNWDPSVFNFN